ncbi:MAG: N-6 DNA methylase [Acidimicrobiales bacterium]|nr:N-6 DNA methylase [Acidimicrobiales bacterium]
MTPLELLLDELRERAAHGSSPRELMGAVAASVADRLGLPAPMGRWPWRPDIDDDLVHPHVLGQVHEALVSPAERRRGGVHYTPRTVARRLSALAIEDWAASTHPGRAPVVCDPAAGGGAFLLAAADELVTIADAATVVGELLVGAELDPLAAEIANAALTLWAGMHGVTAPVRVVEVGDAFDLAGRGWPGSAGRKVDVVVGNPPFLGQLRRRTARAQEVAERMRAVVGPVVTRYVDTALVFCVLGATIAEPGGRVVLVMPESALSTHDGIDARHRLAELASLRGVWLGGPAVFDADVSVCAVVLGVGEDTDGVPLRRWRGSEVEPVPSADRAGVPQRLDAASWAPLVADLHGVPPVALAVDRTLADDVVSATAGFRDEYYAIVAQLREHATETDLPAITVGLVDPLQCRWGESPARLGGRRWDRPAIDLDDLAGDAPRVAAWLGRLLVPKLLLATQTPVIEVAVDATGSTVPVTPVVAVVVSPERLFHVAAALSAPPVTAWAMAHAGGRALAPGHLRLRASDVATLPAPSDVDAWDDGAELARRIAASPAAGADELLELGHTMTAAYGADPSLVEWWWRRLPARIREGG